MAQPTPEVANHCQSLLDQYFRQVGQMSPLPMEAIIAGEAIADRIRDFRAGQSTAEQIIEDAVVACLTPANRLRGTEASKTLEKLSYDVGEQTGRSREEVTQIWLETPVPDWR